MAAVAAGGAHTCALTDAGAVKCWGYNVNGQLGDGTTAESWTPVAVSGHASGVTALAAGTSHSCALTLGGGIKCWGSNSNGQLGDGSTTERLTSVTVTGHGSGVAALAAGGEHSCVLTDGGAVKCWGRNDYGQLGDGSTTERLTPVAVSGLASGVAAISAGDYHTCALTAAGGVKCWGYNADGRLGDGTTEQSSVPVVASGLASGVAMLAAGGSHTCVVTTGGAAKCWGANGNGQLGDGGTTNRSTPALVSGLASGVVAVAAGGAHSCALTDAHSVTCWGLNDFGQLGDGTTAQSLTPASAVSWLAPGAAAVSAGSFHTCAVTTAGALKCWGRNFNGQLGDGTQTSTPDAVAVSGLGSGVAAVAAGGAHTCALTDAGAAKCWGYNLNGQLGDGTTAESWTPVAVSGHASGVAAVAAGTSHTCAVALGGGIKCWGSNSNGQLGDGSSGTDRLIAGYAAEYSTCGDGVVEGAEDCDGGGCCAGDCSALLAAATSCRASAGSCDVAEMCDGASSACPADVLASLGTECRASAGTCDSAESCTGSATACPDDAFVSAAFTCRASAGACDLAETCTGGAAACPADAKNTAECRGAAGVCDVAESCDGSSNDCPADVLTSAGTECRASGGACDVVENCTGNAAACPADGFVGAGNPCRGSAGTCDLAESCTGSAAACPVDAKSTAQCRGAAGACDVAESCDGSGNDCPADALASAGAECRASAGACDLAETCSGGAAACPADTKSTVQCRGAAGLCDVAESCDGSGNDCPADALTGLGTECRASAGVCDVVENCTGSAAACPADAFVSAGSPCRGSAGTCDLSETCTGSAAACPADAKSTAQCRGAAGLCDVAESCDGSGNDCPADALASAGAECRASAGACDLAETCTGSATACPADAKSTALCRGAAGACDVVESCDGSGNHCPADVLTGAGTECRASAGACDLVESCTGSAAACPTDGFANASTECRASAGSCDAAESCTGNAASCPADVFTSAGTECRAVAGACDVIESCTGSASSCPADGFAGAGTQCRATAGACDAAESCDGAGAGCPADEFLVDGTECSAEGMCVNGGTCQAGTCEGTVAPRDDCRVALRPLGAKLKLTDSVVDPSDRLGWAWKVGERTTLLELGGPDQPDGAAYELCVFDESGLDPELLLSAEVAPGPGWSPLGSTGYKFSDKLGAQDGITQILAKAGADGRASVSVKGKGVGLTMPVLPLGLPARVQLEVAGGVCFEATFEGAGMKKNTAGQFLGFGD